MRFTLALTILVCSLTATAGPVASPGDIGLRHEIQMLADYGAIQGPTTAWPVSWDAILADLEAAYESEMNLPVAVRATFVRVLNRARRETARSDGHFNYRASASEKPTRIRGYTNAPYEKGELSAGYSWANSRFSIDINATGAMDPLDDEELRADGSRLAVDWGNVTIAASTMDRWWGPGWDGSLILSNNARPMPAITIGRNRTHAFETKWLSWLGPWDLEVMFGQMEEERVIPNAHFFGMRFTFRPHPSLEIGLSRSAQLCGEGRPCGFDTYWDMFLGKDNVGDAGTTPENEPGNQIAGFDARWSNTWLGTPMAFYAQIMGEDEAGGFPSRYMGMGGVELTHWSNRSWNSYRWFAEIAGVSCDIFDSNPGHNCAYNNSIYQTGYRYRGRVIGHGAEGGALIGTLGMVMVTGNGNQISALIRSGELNKGGRANNTLTPVPLDILSADLTYAHTFGDKHRLEVGIGYEELENAGLGINTDDTRAFLQWRYNP